MGGKISIYLNTLIITTLILSLSCASKKNYISKIKVIDSANPDIYIVVVEQEGADIEDAREKAMESAIDKTAEIFIKSNYEKYLYDQSKHKLYKSKDLIVDRKEEIIDKSIVKVSFAVSKSRIKEQLAKSKISRKNISYRNNRFTPNFLVKIKQNDCKTEEIEFINSTVAKMVSRLGARFVSPENKEKEEIEEIEEQLSELVSKESEFFECIAYECDFVIELKTKCGRNFSFEFTFLEPTTSLIIAKDKINLDFPKSLTPQDVLEEGVYRLFLTISENYPRYAETLNGLNKIIFIEENIDENELKEKLKDQGIDLIKKISTNNGTILIVNSSMGTEEMGITIPYIFMEEGRNFKVGFQNRKFISLHRTDI
ncbi:MAG: hypothetical protein NZ927_07630 [Candidatus Calescibacterium sp.]|nr:hypothetical protein [Candidatus Calescibacterium sp.]MCX7734721.1 hypothetical protein [bacterium]